MGQMRVPQPVDEGEVVREAPEERLAQWMCVWMKPGNTSAPDASRIRVVPRGVDEAHRFDPASLIRTSPWTVSNRRSS